MKVTLLGCLALGLVLTPQARTQTSDDTATAENAPKSEDAQAKALEDQIQRETAARKAEADAAIAADIAKHPDGANAQAARKAAADKAAADAAKDAADEKAKADAASAAKAAADKAENDRKEAAAQWAAGAPERARLEAAKKAAVEKWRAGAKPAPNIIVRQRSDGTFAVMVAGQVSIFPTAAEAQAFAAKARSDADSALSY